jgi:hypothetical protein
MVPGRSGSERLRSQARSVRGKREGRVVMGTSGSGFLGSIPGGAGEILGSMHNYSKNPCAFQQKFMVIEFSIEKWKRKCYNIFDLHLRVRFSEEKLYV